MRMVEIVGGLYTQLPETEYRFVKKMIEKSIRKIKKENLSDKAQVIAERLVDLHVLDFDGVYLYLREVHLK